MRQTSSQSALTTQLNFLFELVKSRAESIRKLKQVDGTLYGTSIEGRRFDKHAKSLQKSIDAVADSYSRAWNHGIAVYPFPSLPRELRDMIYVELMHLERPCGNGIEQRRRRNKPMNGWDYRSATPEHNELLTSEDYSHFFQSEYMGTTFVTELSERFHEDRNFNLQHPGELEGFLSTDRFGTLCEPAVFVRSISIDLSLELFNVRTGNCRDWSSPKFDTPLKQHFVAALRGLEHLKSLAQKNKGVRHTLHLRVDCETRGHGSKFAEVLGPLYYDLKGQDWNIVIDGRYTDGRPRAQLTARDFDYNMTRAEWTKKIRNNTAFATDDPARVTKNSRRGTYGVCV